MKEIEISVSRTFPKDQLTDEWRKKSPDGQFTAGPFSRTVPADLDEAIAKFGKVDIYNSWMKQHRLDLQNEVAEQIAGKVLDPKKVSKRTGKAIAVSLD